MEDCGRHLSYLIDDNENDITKPEYILNSVAKVPKGQQLQQLIDELVHRFKKMGDKLSYDLVGKGNWNDKLISSIVKHAVSQAVALQKSADLAGQPQPKPFKRWLDMSKQEKTSLLSDPTRAEQTQRWLALTAEERQVILKRLIARALTFSLN